MASEPKSVVVVGGGVLGLSCAYYLAKAGRQVTVIESDPTLLSGASEGNAGMIVPSHFIPLAAPGVISQGLKWMLNPKSPFFLRPRLDFDLMRWVWTFYRHANAGHVQRSEKLLRDLGLESRRLHVELAKTQGYDLIERGLLMLCQSEEGLEDEAAVAVDAQRLGLEAEVFNRDALAKYEPDTQVEARGGVWFAQDCHLSPMDFIKALRQAIKAEQGAFIHGEVRDFVKSQGQVSAVQLASGETVAADEIVLTGGIDTSQLSEPLGLRLPMQGGKGYSLTLKDPAKSLRLCSLLKEGRVAVTPMGRTLRVAGTMEICGNNRSVSRPRLQGIIESFCRFYPDFQVSDFEGIEPWVGLRPCSPDGLPYLGRVRNHSNLTIASGHSMMGLSLAPVSGMLVEKLIAGEQTPLDLKPLDPARFG